MSDENNIPSILSFGLLVIGITACYRWAREWDRKLALEDLSDIPRESVNNKSSEPEDSQDIEETEESSQSNEINNSQNRETRRAKSSNKKSATTEAPYYQKFSTENTSI